MHQLSCHCGTVRGAVLPGWPSARVRCYCSDCRAFAHFLDPKSKVLDAQGGTELVQVSQSRLRIDQGMDHVQAVRLTDKGLLRWYAGCCRTPIGNTLPTLGVNFIGLVTACLDGAALERDFGAAVAQVYTEAAQGSPKPRQRGFPGLIVKFLAIALGGKLLPSQKGSPLFRGHDAPVCVPRVLAPAELQQLKRSG